MRVAQQLHRLLQSRARKAVRAAIGGGRRRQAQEAGMGDRKKASRGRSPADHLLQSFRILLAAAGQELDDDGQQHHQQLSYGGCLARLGAFASVGLLLGMLAGETALAQKQGGVLKMSHFDSPASMSLHEEATAAANRPMMGVFNNLVMYKQDVPQNSMQSIVPDLAVSWSWSEE